MNGKKKTFGGSGDFDWTDAVSWIAGSACQMMKQKENKNIRIRKSFTWFHIFKQFRCVVINTSSCFDQLWKFHHETDLIEIIIIRTNEYIAVILK